MSLSAVVAAVRSRMEARRRYRRLVAEIASLTQAELIDIGAFQADLYRRAREQVYG